MRRCSFSLFGLLLLLACPRTSEPKRPYPGPATASERHALVAIGDIAEDFMMRQKISAKHGGETFSFEAVLQKQGDTLVIVGLGPFGTRAFTIVQRGREVELETHGDQTLPFPPEYVLEDVARAFLWPREAPGTGCCSTRETDGEQVKETWQGEMLVEREFRRVDDDPPGRVIVHYEDGMVDRPPRRTILRNERHDYVLDIETFDYRVLDK